VSQTVIMEVGSLGWWHAIHIPLSIATAGTWLDVYAIHPTIAAVSPSAVTAGLPEVHRIQYRGYSHVLAP
jgi:hypothetical protein